MSKPAFDEFNTVYGRVKAVRVTDENMMAVADWCEGTIEEKTELDAPDTWFRIALTSTDRHFMPKRDFADVGEWVVQNALGSFFVYAYELFLHLITDTDEQMYAPNADRLEQVTKLMYQLMEFHEHVVNRGGTLSESSGAVEFAAMQIERIYR